MRNYQEEYAATRPQMYDKKSRTKKGERIVKLIAYYFGKKTIKTMKLLDIGGSTGIIADYLANNFQKVVVTDIDKGAIDFAKKHFKKSNLIFKIDDAMKLSFKENTFDVVICTHVYEHVPSPQKLFKEIHRILKPGGVCYLAAQNKLFPWEPHHNLMLLSLLPKKIADLYVRLFRGKKEYYEHPMTYWQLKKVTQNFKVHDFTSKILSDPKRYGYNFPFLAKIIAPLGTYFSPTFFWLIEK